MSKISPAYRRGFQRGVAAAAAVAFDRRVSCEKAADSYVFAYPDNPSMAATERCAASEAAHIWELILKLKPTQDAEAA